MKTMMKVKAKIRNARSIRSEGLNPNDSNHVNLSKVIDDMVSEGILNRKVVKNKIVYSLKK